MPSKAELMAAAGRTVADVIAPGLTVLFCGINPGLYSGFAGHHFARPGNRFWPVLHAAGFTPRLLQPAEEHALLPLGYGITNLVVRSTARADELDAAELVDGAQRLAGTVARYQPRVVAVLGISAYRTAFQQPQAAQGRQPGDLGTVPLWVLPNPSGLNAHYTLTALAAVFRDFRLAVQGGQP